MMTHSPQKIMRNLATASLVGLTLVLAACGGAAGATDTRVEAPLAPDVTAPTIQDDPEDQLESYTPDYLSFDQIIMDKDNLSPAQLEAALSYLNAGDFDLSKPSHQKLALTLFEYLDINDATQRETAHSILRANRGEGESRVIVQRDGNWVVASVTGVGDLEPGDQIDISNGTSDLVFVRSTGVPVFHGLNDGDIPFVFDAQNPDPVITRFLVDTNFNHGLETRGQVDQHSSSMTQHGFFGENLRDNPTILTNSSWIFVTPYRTFEGVHAGGAELLGIAALTTNDMMDVGMSIRPEGFMSRSQIESRLRTIARNNPNVVVIGFDGNRITG